MTGNSLPKITIPAVGNRGNILESKTSQEYYNDQIASGATPEKAFWDTTVKTVIDMTVLVPMLRQFSKEIVTKTNPSALINPEKINITRETVRDILTGRIKPEGVELPPELKKSMLEMFSKATSAEKRTMLGGIELLKVKPSALGKILGVSEAEANQLLKTTFGGPIRETPVGALPGTATVGTPQPAFGLSIRPVKKVGGVEVPKITEGIKDIVSKELSMIDTAPLTIKGKYGDKALIQNSDLYFRLEQLKNKVNEKALSEADIKEAIPLLKQAGIDVYADIKPKTAPEQVVTPIVEQSYNKITTPANIPATTIKKDTRIMDTSISKLEEEAKKLSKDEFIKSQGTPVYHGTDKQFTKFDPSKGHIWFTDNKNAIIDPKIGVGASGKGFIVERIMPKNLKLATPEYADNYFTDQLIAEGYDGVFYPGIKSEGTGNFYQIFDAKKFENLQEKVGIKSQSQLEQIWEKANKKSPIQKLTEHIKKLPKNRGTVDFFAPLGGPKKISEVDRLISEGKIKLKSKDGRDIYQYKKGNEWVNARDEDSAIKAVTPKPKTQVELSPELQQKQYELEVRREVIENSPLNFPSEIIINKKGKKQAISPLASIINIREGEIRELGDTTGKVSKRIEDLMGKAGYEDPTKFKEDLERFVEAKKSLKEYEKIFRQQIAMEKGKKIVEEKPIVAPKKDIPQFEGEQGEVKSLELVARERESLSDGEVDVPGVSLNKIISNTVTPVEKKVGIIDTFLRTPDRVMKSIGFGQEAKELRSSMDEYWKELPKNIEKINEWRKSLPTESNERIFKFLDGQAITLNAQENKVAGEIRVWLKNWAKRLGLAEDRQITDYITRIFDQDSAKEFNEELAKLIADKIPGSVYNPFLLKRLGAKGYKQDTWLALSAYTKRATRKVHMDPVLAKIKEKTGGSLELSNIEKTQFKYIQNYVNNINLRPSDLDEAIDTSFKKIFSYKLGGRPVNKGLRMFRQATFRGMLGLNPGSALRNLSQGINTYATLGEKYTTIGYASLFKKGAMKELEEQGVLNAGFIQDKVLSATGKAIEKVDKVLFAFFDGAEKINRGSAYFGAKSKALAEGKTEVEAIEYAKEIVRKTQFVFDVIDTPVGLSSDIMKTFFQFQTFTTKQIEFLTEMAKDKNMGGLFRYALAGLLFVFTIGKAFNMEPKELLPIYRFQVPPSMKFPFEIGKALFDAPDKYGQKRDIATKASDIGKSLIGYIPAGTQAKKTIGGIQAVKEGGSYNKAGQLQYEQGESLASKIQSILFGKYAQENAQKYFDKIEINKKEKTKIQPIYDQVKKIDEEGRGEEAQAIVDDLSDADYEIYKKIKTAEKTKKTLEGKKKMLPIYNDIQKMSDEEAQKALDSLSNEEYEYYKAIKKDRKELEKAKDGEKPEFGEAQTDENIIKTVWTYAKAIGVDPVTAFNRIFTGQRIRYVTNGVIVVERLPLSESQKIKEEQGGANPTMKLDHTIPLQLGGSNDKDNLKLVPTDEWATYTPIENAIGLAVRGNKISKKEAQELIKGFKNGDITSEDVYLKLK
jgi:hypothetical protein